MEVQIAKMVIPNGNIPIWKYDSVSKYRSPLVYGSSALFFFFLPSAQNSIDLSFQSPLPKVRGHNQHTKGFYKYGTRIPQGQNALSRCQFPHPVYAYAPTSKSLQRKCVGSFLSLDETDIKGLCALSFSDRLLWLCTAQNAQKMQPTRYF